MQNLNKKYDLKCKAQHESIFGYGLYIAIKSLLLCLLLSSCSSYKSSWDCKDPKGFGCTSIEYADFEARKDIVLGEAGSATNKKNKILIKEHYSDFERVREQEIEFK